MSVINIQFDRHAAWLDGSESQRAIEILDSEFWYEPRGARITEEKFRQKLRYRFAKLPAEVAKKKIREILDKYDPTVKLVDLGDKSFPPGLVRRAERILIAAGFETVIGDQFGNSDKEFVRGYPINFEPRPHQIASQESSHILFKYRLMVKRMATGAGKTFDACMTIASLGLPTMFVVPSKLLLEQAYEDFAYFFGSDKIGRLGAGYHEEALIQIATLQSIGNCLPKKKKANNTKEDGIERQKKRYERVVKTKLLIIDEVHRIPADDFYETAFAFDNAEYVLGYTATDRRIDGATLKIEAAAGYTGYTILAPSLINDGFLVPPLIYFDPIPARQLPFMREKTRVDFFRDYNLFSKHQIIENEQNHEIIAGLADREAANRKFTLIAINKVEHGKGIYDKIKHDCALVTSQTPKAWEKIKDFRNGEYPILISTLCAEGFNAPCIDNLIIAQDSTDSEQIVGRGLRLNEGKSVCHVHHTFARIPDDKIWSAARYMVNHAEKCREIYRELEYPIMKDL